MLGCQPGKLRIEVGRETLPSAGEIYLLDFFRLTPRPMGRGSFVRSFVRSGSFNDFPKSKLLVYAKDEGN